MNNTYIRAAIQDTGTFGRTIYHYATLENTVELRLAVTKHYVEGDVIPENSCSLLQNSPMLYAVAKVSLPALPDLFIVFDYPGLTTQRRPREIEVESLITSLNERAGGKVKYAVEPIEATNDKTAEAAAIMILKPDCAFLTPDTAADLLYRMR